MTENEIGSIIVDSSIAVHRELGPGVLESVYEIVLCYELEQRGLKPKSQVPVPIMYKGFKFEQAFRADIIVNNKVVIELKSIKAISNRSHPTLTASPVVI